jgi:peptidoglycan hydrolase-like protein with peptidoglycan-binding domain
MSDMSHKDLQLAVQRLGFDPGAIDGIWGGKSRAATIACLKAGPDLALTASDVAQAAAILDVEPYKIWAVYEVEATGNPFTNGMPTILFEPHRFSKATGHRYDASHPKISSKVWNKKLYPASQQGRWDQVMDAVALDVDAGFASASYGGFQILGENFAVCGAPSPWAFAWRQSQTVGDQMDAFVLFVKGNGLAAKLRACQPGDPDSCIPFVSRYNGSAFRSNNYHVRFATGLTAMKKRYG